MTGIDFRKFRAIILITVVIIVGYWQVAFLRNSLKWDILDCYLPWRYHHSECMLSGEFPLWNPFQNFGYPIHADMHSTYYPPVWLIGSTTGYSNITFHFILLLYLIIAGYGMFRLSFHFTGNDRSALITGIAYVLSGYFFSHAQELSTLAGAAWLPYVLLFYLRTLQLRRYFDAAVCTVFLFLVINGGYQALTIILLYLLLLLFLYYIVKALRDKDYRNLFSLLKLNLLIAGLLILLNLPTIISLYQVIPHVSRFGGLAEDSISSFPFSPQSLLSLFLPFAVVKEVQFFDTDITMNNAYTGIIILGFFILALFRKRTAIEYIFIGFGLFSLFAAFGDYTPLRGILYHYVPLMNMFRGSAYFRLFFILPVFLLAGNSLSLFLKNPASQSKQLLQIIIA
ncbi:MAG: hypothetical protein KJ607_03025, partial [Bacteroidetes bacterium]|nr:hypothetical protein [Bacteroidota bacterium]